MAATETETAALGYIQPKGYDRIREGDEAIRTNARKAAGHYLSNRSATQAVAATVGDPGGVITTTTTDRNLQQAAMPTGWRAVSTAVSTFSTGTDSGRGFARSTALAAGDTGAYHGVMTTARPPITVPSDTPAHLVARVRSTGSATARIYIQFLQGSTSLGITGNTTDHPVSSAWTTLTIPVTVPAAADNYRPTVSVLGPYPAGGTLDVHWVGIITSSKGYFDGDTPDTFTTGVDTEHAWDGAPGESTSTRTVTTRTPGAGLGGRTVVQAINDIEGRIDGGPTGTLVTPPAGFALRRATLPTIRRDGTRYTTDVDNIIDALMPPAGVTYYVSPTGTGDGSSSSSPTTLALARDKSDVGTIVLAPGEYNRSQAAVTGRTTKSIRYLASGPGVRLTGWSQTLAWTHTAGNVYQAARTGAVSVGDPRVQHALDGVVNMYPKAGTTAAEVTGPGQWATDGTTVWAWALGDTDLAANPTAIRVGLGVDVGIMHNGGTAYVEGITIEGSGAARGAAMIGGTLLLRDCTIQGAAANGITAVDALVVAARTDASGNGSDGFNYHETSGRCDFIEVDCTARRNGWLRQATNNGSTAHETTHGVRVGGNYRDCHGPIIADVNASQTWTLGATTTRTDPAILPPAIQQGHYQADGTDADMWVQDADIDGLGMAWRVSNGGTIAVRDPRRVTTENTPAIDALSTLTRY